MYDSSSKEKVITTLIQLPNENRSRQNSPSEIDQSQKPRHHTTKQALSVALYDFVPQHETQKGNTPARACNPTEHVWTIKELIEKAAA